MGTRSTATSVTAVTLVAVDRVPMLRMLTFAASLLVLKTAMELWLAESLLSSSPSSRSLA